MKLNFDTRIKFNYDIYHKIAIAVFYPYRSDSLWKHPLYFVLNSNFRVYLQSRLTDLYRKIWYSY
jgi:hypothetical protein